MGSTPSRREQAWRRAGDETGMQCGGRAASADDVGRVRPPVSRSRPGGPCARRMIPLESPVPEIGTPGSGSRGWKRDHGSRTEARSESDGIATGPYRRRASP